MDSDMSLLCLGLKCRWGICVVDRSGSNRHIGLHIWIDTVHDMRFLFLFITHLLRAVGGPHLESI